MCTTSKVQEIRERGYQLLNALESNEPWVSGLLKEGLNSRYSEVADLCFQGLLLPIGCWDQTKNMLLAKVSRNNEDEDRQERAIAPHLQQPLHGVLISFCKR